MASCLVKEIPNLVLMQLSSNLRESYRPSRPLKDSHSMYLSIIPLRNHYKSFLCSVPFSEQKNGI